MAFSCFCQIDGIKGECREDGHKEWIELRSFHHGVSQAGAGSVSAAGGLSAGSPDHDLFTVVKALDKSSPLLAVSCCRGKPIGTVTVELWRHIGDKPSKFMSYKLTKAMIKSVRPGGGAKSGEDVPLEEVGLAYERIDWNYTEHDGDGSPKGEVPSYYDLAKQVAG